jgi:hypothetical protein
MLQTPKLGATAYRTQLVLEVVTPLVRAEGNLSAQMEVDLLARAVVFRLVPEEVNLLGRAEVNLSAQAAVNL